MRALMAVIVLGMLLGASVPAGAETRPDNHKTETRTPAKPDAHAPAKPESHGPNAFNRNLALVGGGLLGVVLASGAVNVAFAGSLMYQGAAIAEALEAGAGLTVPIALLAGALGALFGQDIVLSAMTGEAGGEHGKPAH